MNLRKIITRTNMFTHPFTKMEMDKNKVTQSFNKITVSINCKIIYIQLLYIIMNLRKIITRTNMFTHPYTEKEMD